MKRLTWVRFILGINLMVFIGLRLLPETSASSMILSLFVVSWDSLVQGRFWTLLTSVFSHLSIIHWLVNMLVLINFGPVLERVLGPRRFIVFYLLAGVLSSLGHCFVSAYLLGTPGVQALGASGALSGLVFVFSLLFPKEILFIFGLIPVPALLCAMILAGIDIWGVIAHMHGGGFPIGHGAHLAGALTGVLYFFIYLRPQLRGISEDWPE